MKKENKKIAQQRRAEERKKQARKDILEKVCKIVFLLWFLIFIAIFVVNPFSKSDNATDTSLTVENGDTVNIDYVGSIDGVEFAGGNTQGAGADLVIGSGTYIDDFEEQLIASGR